MTTQEYSTLKHLEQKFEIAINHNYLPKVLRQDIDLLFKMYEKYTRKKTSRSCSGCVLRVVKYIGKRYMERKEGFAKKKKDNQLEIDFDKTKQEVMKGAEILDSQNEK